MTNSENEKTFTPGPDCSSLEWCQTINSCGDAEVIRQAVKDDTITEHGNVRPVLRRCLCQNPENLQARAEAEKYLEAKTGNTSTE